MPSDAIPAMGNQLRYSPPPKKDMRTIAAQKLGIEYQLEKVTDINEIMKFGVMMTPALAVDGQVKVTGKVPSVDEIAKLIA